MGNFHKPKKDTVNPIKISWNTLSSNSGILVISFSFLASNQSPLSCSVLLNPYPALYSVSWPWPRDIIKIPLFFSSCVKMQNSHTVYHSLVTVVPETGFLTTLTWLGSRGSRVASFLVIKQKMHSCGNQLPLALEMWIAALRSLFLWLLLT